MILYCGITKHFITLAFPAAPGSAGASQGRGQHQSLGEAKEEEEEEDETHHMTQQIWDSILMPQEEEETREAQGNSSRYVVCNCTVLLFLFTSMIFV